MSAAPRVDAMKPGHPGPTRTAPPRPPDGFPSRGRYRAYLLFGTGGFFLLIEALLALRVVWALGNGEAALARVLNSFGSPAYVLFHVVALAWITWFTLRFFRLFPKTQPFRMGPIKRPPDAVMVTGLTGAFVVVTLVVVLVLGGVL